ncbi:unnamed protein product, partial [Mesorhabditis belari]|uniref:DUF19 domain-containing protein n=1 Tax=Mesorhabditis belari TaxID=2138241 RepID=A0AAF3EE82_9BILA
MSTWLKVLLLISPIFGLREVFFSPPYMMQPIPAAQGPHNQENVQRTSDINNGLIDLCTSMDQQRIRQCADPLYSIGAFSEDDNENGNSLSLTWDHFLTKTQDYFSLVCDNFYIFDMCIEPYKDICFSEEPVRHKYQTAIKILDFLCRDGYNDMIRNFECFTRTLTRAEMMQCQAEMVADTRKIPPIEEIGNMGQQAAICGAVRNYVDCIKLPIRYECGYRAWHLVRELVVRPTAALLPQCDILYNGSTSRILSFILILTVFTFIF